MLFFQTFRRLDLNGNPSGLCDFVGICLTNPHDRVFSLSRISIDSKKIGDEEMKSVVHILLGNNRINHVEALDVKRLAQFLQNNKV